MGFSKNIMKVLALSALCLAGLYAQTAPQAPVKPLPDLPDTEPVASFDDGYVMTMAELRGLLIAVGNPQASANIPAFLDQWAIFRKMAKMALDDKLDKDYPVNYELEYARNSVLAQAEVTHQANPIVPNSEEQKYYEAHKSEYGEVKTYDIYVAFSSAAASQTDSEGKKILSEMEAKAKIEKLLAEIRKGGDFKKLARENSDDDQSRNKDGFFGNLKPTDPMPDAIRAAVFSLKPGETTDVIAQPNGFYLFKAEDVSYKLFSEVKDQVDRAYKDDQFKRWMQKMQAETKATILNPKLK